MNEQLTKQLTKSLKGLSHDRMLRPRWDRIWERFNKGVDVKVWEFKGGTQPISITLNYRCYGPCNDKQIVQCLGLLITLWHPDSSLVSDSHCCLISSGVETIMAAIGKLSGKVRKMCPHKNCTVQGIGNCLHRWTCKDCGKSLEVDSSG